MEAIEEMEAIKEMEAMEGIARLTRSLPSLSHRAGDGSDERDRRDVY